MIDHAAIKLKWLLDMPTDERCVWMTSWRGIVLIATESGNIYHLKHDEVAGEHRLVKVAP